MRLIFCLLFYICIFISPVYAEGTIHQKTLDYVLQTPPYTNLSQLTFYLTKPYQDDYEKARAIAYYIASHVAYDEYLYNNGKKTRLQRKKRSPQEILQSKVGVCSDFALLFTTMSQMAGIRARTVNGHVFDVYENTYMVKRSKKPPHAWNYFDYKGRKVLVDTTWMAGGKTGYENYVTEFNHRQAINELKKKDLTYSVDPFYFDFNAKEEKEKFLQLHVSKNKI